MKATEKTQKNKDLIIAAAIKILARHGFSGTTVTRVAQAAGVSRGLLHYHFKNVEELLAEAVHTAFEPMGQMLGQLFEQAQSGEELARTISQSVRQAIQEDPDAIALMIEALAVSRHSDPVGERMRLILDQSITAQGKQLKALAHRAQQTPLVSPQHLPRLLVALMDGVGLQAMLHPPLNQDQDFWAAFERLLAALFHAPQEAP